MSGGYSCYCY